MGNEKPQINLETKKPWCDSHASGHRVHWIQARVQRAKPRFDAEIEILDETHLKVTWLESSHIFTHHNIADIEAALATKVLDYVKFAPDANLLYIQTEEPNDKHGGVFSVSYLSRQELTECTVRPDAIRKPPVDW